MRIAFAVSVWSRTLLCAAYFFYMAAAGSANGKGYVTLPGHSTAAHSA